MDNDWNGGGPSPRSILRRHPTSGVVLHPRDITEGGDMMNFKGEGGKGGLGWVCWTHLRRELFEHQLLVGLPHCWKHGESLLILPNAEMRERILRPKQGLYKGCFPVIPSMYPTVRMLSSCLGYQEPGLWLTQFLLFFKLSRPTKSLTRLQSKLQSSPARR